MIAALMRIPPLESGFAGLDWLRCPELPDRTVS